jgi:hypothetical protein
MTSYRKGQAPIAADDASYGPAWAPFGGGVIPPPGPVVCSWIDFDQVFEFGTGSSFVRDTLNKEYDITTDGSTFDGFNFINTTNSFNSETSSVSLENTVVSAGSPASGFGVGFAQLTGVPQDPVRIIAAIINQAGTLVDFVSGLPTGGSATFQTGYKMGVTFDFSAGTASGYDSAANVSALEVDENYDPFVDVVQIWLGGSAAATTNVFSPNTGDRAFELPQSTGVGFCNAVPLPPPVLCSIENGSTFLNLYEGAPPDTQTLALSGANNLTVTATSQGNPLFTGSGVSATHQFQTNTEEVKIETTLTTVPTLAGGLVQPNIVLGFYHDLLGVSPVLICGLVYAPIISGGTVIDAAGGIIKDTGIGFVDPTTIAAYIDPTPQQKIYVFQAQNQAIAGSVNVHGVNVPVNDTDTQEQIAALIVSDWALFGADPTVEDVYLGDPSDNRSVFIKYTSASQDATVSVTPTNVSIFDNFPDDEKPYQTGTARAKIENTGGSADYDIEVAAAYDSSLDVYMAIGINTGDSVGQTFVQTINFGSASFLLGEDAKRWCNVSPPP